MATNIPSERSKAAPYPKCGMIQADLFRVTRALLMIETSKHPDLISIIVSVQLNATPKIFISTRAILSIPPQKGQSSLVENVSSHTSDWSYENVKF